MASGTIKGITIEIGGNTAPLQNALKDVNSTTKALAGELKDVERLLKLDPSNVELLKQKQELLAKEVDNTSEKLEKLKSVQDQVAEQAKNGEIGEEQYRAFQREISATEIELKKFQTSSAEVAAKVSELENATDSAGDQFQETGDNADKAGDQVEEAGKQSEKSGDDAQKGEGGWKKLGDALLNVGKIAAEALAAATAAVVAFAKESVSVGAEFDASMSQVSAVSGAAGEDFDALRDKALEMGSKTKFSASEAADAMNYMAMAGWKTGDMLEGIEGIMNLAAASGEDLATTSDIVTDALTAFGLSASDSGHFADVLAAASSSANTNVSMLGESFKYVAPLAGSLGYSVEDVSIALGTMANAGIKGSQAGTTLKTALANLSNPTENMINAMASLGLVTKETVNTIDGDKLSKAQTKVANNTNSMEKAQINYNAAVEKYGESSDQAQKAALSLSTAQNNLAQAQKELETVMAGENETILGQNLALTDADGNMRTLGDTLAVIREAFAGLSETEKASAAATIFGKEAMAGMLSVINSSDEDFDKLTSAIYDADKAAEEMAQVMQDNLAGDITIFKSALEGAQITLSDVLTPSLREFVQFGTEAVSTLSEAFKDGGLSGAMDALGTILSEGLAMVVDAIPGFVDAGMQLLEALGQGILDNLPTIADAALNIITMLTEKLVEALPKIVEAGVQIISSLIEGLGQMLPTLIPAIVQAVVDIAQTLIEQLPTLIDAVLELIKGLAEGIIEAIPIITEALPEIIDAAVDTLIELIPTIIDCGIKLFVALVEALPEIITTICEAIPDIIDAVIDAFVTLIPAIIECGVTLFIALVENLPEIIDAIIEAVPEIVEAIVNSFDRLIPAIIEAGVKLFVALTENLPQIIQTIGKAVPEIVNSIVEGFKKLFSKMAQVGKELFEKIVSRGAEIKSTVTSWISGLVNSIISTIQGFFSAFSDVGWNIVNGIWSGISSGWSWLTSQVSSLATGLLDSVKGFLGIGSPSKKFRDEVGRWIPAGIGEGFKLELPKTFNDMRGRLNAEEKKLAAASRTISTVNNNTSLGGINVTITGNVGSVAEAERIGDALAERVQRNMRYKGVLSLA